MQVLKGIALARVLGPASYGVWSVLSTMQSLSVMADAGVSAYSAKTIPEALGREDRATAQAAGRTGVVWLVAVSIVIGVVVAFTRVAGAGAGSWSVRALVPLLFVVMNTFVYGLTVARAFFSFKRAAAVAMVTALVGLGLGVPAAAKFGLGG